jgi:hypothetical protein
MGGAANLLQTQQLSLLVFDERTDKDRSMDTVNQYREIIRQIITQYAGYKPSHGAIDTEMVIDRERDHYEVIHIGWDGDRRVHGPIIHIDIIGRPFTDFAAA